MKQIKLRTPLTACLLAGALILGAGAAATVEQIAATLRPDITVEVNGETATLRDKNGDVVYPITYNGSTYLPIRAIGGLLDQEVLWDSKTQTVSLSDKTDTALEDLTHAALTNRSAALETRRTALTADVDATAKAGTYSENLTIYRSFENRRTALSADLQTLRVDVSEARRAGNLTADQRKGLDATLDALEGKLDTLGQRLVNKYGVSESGTYKSLRAEADTLATSRTALEKLVNAASAAKSYETWKTADNDARKSFKTFRNGVTALQVAMNDSLRQSAITYAQYNELAEDADLLDNACKDFETALDKAQSAWTGYVPTPDDTWTGKDTEAYANQIATLKGQADTLRQQCKDYFTGKSGSVDQGIALMKQVEALDREIDRLEDAIEDSGKLGRQAKWDLLKSLDKAEDAVDDAEDFLEKAGIDDDWDNDHRGRWDWERGRGHWDDDWDDDWDD